MAASQDLFALIKSLNKAEKRHFKLQAKMNQRQSRNNYVLLFDAFDRLDRLLRPGGVLRSRGSWWNDRRVFDAGHSYLWSASDLSELSL